MSEKNVYVPDEEAVRTLQSSLERELSELRSLHEAHADDLQEAFSPGVINLLRQLSEDDSFFQYPTPEESSSSESFHSSEDTSDYWRATRMTFRFLCDEFMSAPRDQRMGRFQTFLDQVRGTASRIRLPGGASLSPDRNSTLRQCVTAVKTMKEVLESKFASLQKYVKIKMEQGGLPFAGGPGFASNVPQTEAASRSTIFRYSGPSNPEVSRVIRENPTQIRGSGDTPAMTRGGIIVPNVGGGIVPNIGGVIAPNVGGVIVPNVGGVIVPNVGGVIVPNVGGVIVPNVGGVIVPNVARVIQETPPHSNLQQTLEEVNPEGSRPSPPKRYPLRRQSHVEEED